MNAAAVGQNDIAITFANFLHARSVVVESDLLEGRKHVDGDHARPDVRIVGGRPVAADNLGERARVHVELFQWKLAVVLGPQSSRYIAPEIFPVNVRNPTRKKSENKIQFFFQIYKN